MRTFAGALAVVAAIFLAAPSASLAVPFDFTTLGAENTLLGPSVTVNGVTATGWSLDTTGGGSYAAGVPLWLRDVPNDHGLGVCSEGAQSCLAGGGDVNELDDDPTGNGLVELIRLEKPTDSLWTSLWVSSLDSGGTGGAERGTLYWSDTDDPNAVIGISPNFFPYAFGDFGGLVEGDLFTLGLPSSVASATYLFFQPGPSGTNNDHLVWKGDLRPVPEPGTLILVGSGLVGLGRLGWVRRRKAA